MSDYSDYPEISNNTWPEPAPVPTASNGASPHLNDELLAAWAADELASNERNAARRHLASCAYCQRALAETQRIRALVRAAASDAQPAMAPALADRVLARLPSERTAPHTFSPTRGEATKLPLMAPSPQSQRRDLWRRMGALAAVLLLVTSSALLFTRLGSREQTNTPTPTATPASLANLPGTWKGVIPAGATIWDVAVVSPTDIWAAGSAASAGEVKTVLVHFDGVRWRLSADVFSNAGLYSISMVSATEGWAAGNTSDGEPLMLHYTGSHWRDARLSVNAAETGLHDLRFSHVRMASAMAGWALAQYSKTPDNEPPSEVFQRFTGLGHDKWVATESFIGVRLNALTVVSNHEAWMVGAYGDKVFIARIMVSFANSAAGSRPVHWDTHTWENLGAGELTSVSMLSSTDGWAAGADNSGQGILFHWDGQQWTQVDFQPNGANPGPIRGIVKTGANTGWVFGANADATKGYLYSLANGRWYSYPLRANEGILSGVAITPSVLLATTDLASAEGYDPVPALFDMNDGSPVATS